VTVDPLEGAVILCGPTASGKSVLAVELAERLGGEILGADSQQVYRGLAVGTAQPPAALQARVPHHLVGFLDPPERMTAAAYATLARRTAAEVRARGHRVMFCGGTGLYLKAALTGLFAGPPADPELRARLEAIAKREGREALHVRLAQVDPATAARLSPRDVVRVIRALEVFEGTGQPLSTHLKAQRRSSPAVVWLGLSPPREELRRAVEGRTRRLYEEGLLDEARDLVRQQLEAWAPARSLGYRDALAHLRGEISLEEAIARTVRDTRRYAKRQLTWFRAEPAVHWLQWPPHVDEAVAHVDGGAF